MARNPLDSADPQEHEPQSGTSVLLRAIFTVLVIIAFLLTISLPVLLSQ